MPSLLYAHERTNGIEIMIYILCMVFCNRSIFDTIVVIDKNVMYLSKRSISNKRDGDIYETELR